MFKQDLFASTSAGRNMIEIADRIYFIESENRGRYPNSHSLFVDDDLGMVIDPACREELMLELAASHKTSIILNTHYHEDHRIYNYCFTRAQLYTHELDARGYGSIEDFMQDFSVVNSDTLKNFWRDFLLDNCKYRPYTVAQTFSDGFQIDLGHTVVKTIHTPGHSAGHSCFYFPKEQVLYLGDIDLTSFGPWYASRNSDIDAWLTSIERVRRLKPKIVVTSHGDGLVTENLDARIQTYANTIHQRDNRILEFLQRPRTKEEILDLEIVYRRNHKSPDSFFYWDDRMMIEMHIFRLERQGRLKRLDRNYVIG
ncbi:MAG: MBL fold metallo-hydrolase [Candidatus Abyssobacteria bacterium SURF_5]|uniref:MBL fold metallo-hydrolase n=1 Tax=Abyssobacteria bacterium (strain SURF_5) TaxID=2093360 RepID=A0A3A4NHC9_ABYX5|nr:MAG: MBL fold metallo-hydrolase [Candidatus Abyssubacteria bacterium SURF_5]